MSLCLVTTASAGLAPHAFAGLLGLSVADSGGLNEIRSQYAGFFLAVAGLCGSALLRRTRPATVYTLLAALFGGLAAGRLVSLGLNGGIDGYGAVICGLFFVDTVGCAAAVGLLATRRRYGCPAVPAEFR